MFAAIYCMSMMYNTIRRAAQLCNHIVEDNKNANGEAPFVISHRQKKIKTNKTYEKNNYPLRNDSMGKSHSGPN